MLRSFRKKVIKTFHRIFSITPQLDADQSESQQLQSQDLVFQNIKQRYWQLLKAEDKQFQQQEDEAPLKEADNSYSWIQSELQELKKGKS